MYHCVLPEIIHSHPKEVYRKIQGLQDHVYYCKGICAEAVFKRKFFKESLKAGISVGFGCGFQTKQLSWEVFDSFLEQYIAKIPWKTLNIREDLELHASETCWAPKVKKLTLWSSDWGGVLLLQRFYNRVS